jgi:hypothetical protein
MIVACVEALCAGTGIAMSVKNPNASKIEELRRQVQAAQQEFVMATVFHETWKPLAFDGELHKRMGVSFATNTFRVIGAALRREMLLALARLWDTDSRAVRMKHIADLLRDQAVIKALVLERANGKETLLEPHLKYEINSGASEVIELVDQYSNGGLRQNILEKVLKLRHERLAHRNVKAEAEASLDADDGDVETFFQHNAKLIQLLLHIVSGIGYDPNDTAEVYGLHAKLFWAGVRGERTEGHPNFRPVPVMPAK